MINQQTLTERKARGRAFLDSNQMDEALRLYAGILRDYPEDGDTYTIIGDCYLAEGDGDTALLLYEKARVLDPEDLQIARRIQLAHLECKGQLPAAAERIPTDPQEVAGVLQELVRSPEPISEDQVIDATRLLEEIVRSPQPAQAVAERLERIDELLPALLELNIRQAQADGRPDLAQALQELLTQIQMQINTQAMQSEGASAGALELDLKATPRVLFLAPPRERIEFRQTLPGEALSNLGCEVTVAKQFPPDFQERIDVVVARHPHGDPKIVQGLAACAAAGIRIVLDIDLDYEQMPLNHPKYQEYGLGTPANVKSHTAMMLLADQIVVPNEALAERLRSAGYSVQVIPDGWSRDNPLWEKPAPHRSTVNIGILSQPGQLEDVAMIRRIVFRVLREFSQTVLVVAGDLQTYQLFDGLPDSRRIFLPPVNLEDYPYILAQMDILLSPVRNTCFNQAASDRPLMEAGIRRIPWVASPNPAVLNWGLGGLVADTPDEWYAILRQLIQEPKTRLALGRIGREKAEEREMNRLAGDWHRLVSGLTSSARLP